jgi:hypothetical protein
VIVHEDHISAPRMIAGRDLSYEAIFAFLGLNQMH